MEFLATTPLGIEVVTGSELRELGAYSVEVDVGKVFFKGGEDLVYVSNFMLRTANRVFILLLRDRFKDLRDVGRLAEGVEYHHLIPPNASFAVRAERVGLHDFTSLDVGRVVGEAVIKSYASSTGTRLKVDLRRPDVEIYALVRHDEVILGVNTTGDSLHRRGYRVYNHPAALKSTLAAALVRLSSYDGGGFLDPMCGGGTIVVEAAHRLRRYPIFIFRREFAFRRLSIYDPRAEEEVAEVLRSRVREVKDRIYCIDISSKHLRGARLNAESGMVSDTVVFRLGDATLSRTYEGVEGVRHVSTNPPYGIRFHNSRKLLKLYEALLTTLSNLFAGCRAAIITAAVKQFEEALGRAGASLVNVLDVMHGGLRARIYVLNL